MAKRPTVPKFGAWGNDNAGYTAYFDRVRENKVATAPPLHRPYNPNDPEDGPLRPVPPPSARPSTAGERPDGQTHRRAGSRSSDPGDRGAEQSKFAPPPQYHPRPSPQAPQHQQYHGGGGHRHHHPSPGVHGGGGGLEHASPGRHGGGGGRDHRSPQRAPRQQQYHYHHAAPAPRARSASPQSNAPNNRPRASAVPKFGVWDDRSTASAAQGFTVQFERVKRDREVARAGGPEARRPPPPPPPPEPRRCHRDRLFFSKMFGCFHPSDRP